MADTQHLSSDCGDASPHEIARFDNAGHLTFVDWPAVEALAQEAVAMVARGEPVQLHHTVAMVMVATRDSVLASAGKAV